MNILKAFACIDGLVSRLSGQTAQFGQLSTYSQTFSKTKMEFSDTVNYPGVEFTSFTSQTDAGAQITPSAAVISHILSVITWVYQQYNASAVPANVNSPTFLAALLAEFTNTSQWSLGTIINGSPITQRMPDYLLWHFIDSGTDNQLKLWFCDASFQGQFDDYSIIVIPPTPHIDDMNVNQAAIGNILGAFTAPLLLTAVQNAVGTNPPTQVVSQNVTWVDPTVVAPAVPGTVNTNWTAIIYGAAGNDADNIKAAILNYINAHTALTNWPTIYPGLFSNSEYVVIPMWKDIGIPVSGMDPELWASHVKVGKLAAVATANLPAEYGESVTLPIYLNNNLEIAAAIYSAMSFLVAGNPNNVQALYNFSQLYPDYTDLQTSSSDFARMAASTQAFSVALTAALGYAAVLTAYSSVPNGYSRVIRNGLVYLAFTMPGFTVPSTSLVVPSITWLILSQGSYVGS